MTTKPDTTDTVFRHSISVEVPVDRAFEVFTKGFDAWWPREHHIGEAELSEVVLESQLNGRWFERGVDGTECDWGRVLSWDPPRHVAMSWHLNGDFEYDPDPDRSSRVDVRFSAEGDRVTRVDVEHSGLDRHGVGWEKLYEGIASANGWHGILARYREVVVRP